MGVLHSYRIAMVVWLQRNTYLKTVAFTIFWSKTIKKWQTETFRLNSYSFISLDQKFHQVLQWKARWFLQRLKKDKGATNLRIHVECGINCIKSFSILNNTLPISLFQNIDDILWTCAALFNLKTRLICLKREEDRSNVWSINKPFVKLFRLQ